MQRKLQLAFGAALLSTTSLSGAFAQNSDTPNVVSSMDEVTVYATKSAESSFDVPAMTSKVNADDASVATSGNISQLLQEVTGVTVVNGPRRSAQTATIRGFSDEATITLLDNRRQNGSAGHDGLMYVDPSLLKSVEVVRGGASAIYGGGAIGGVVAFETMKASDLLKPGETMGAMTSLGLRSANNEFSVNQSGYMRHGDLDLLASLSHRSSGNIDLGDNMPNQDWGDELPANDDVLSGMVKVGYTFNDFHTVSANIHKQDQDAKEPSNNSGVSGRSNANVDKEIETLQFGVKYNYDNPDNDLLKPTVHLYRNTKDIKKADTSGSNVGRIRTREYTTLGATLENQSKFTVSDAQSHTFAYGVEYYKDDQKGWSNSTAFGGIPTAESRTYGAFLQDTMKFQTSAGLFNVTPALRFDQYKSNDDDGNSMKEGKLSPKLSLAYKPTEEFLLFGSWSRAFRAPSLNETYADGQHFPGNNFLTNVNLRPETVTTIEIGAGVDFKEVFTGADRVQVKGSMFKSRGKDFITQEIGGAWPNMTTQYINIANAEIKGWELEAKYIVDAFKFNTGLSYTKASNKDNGEYLEASQPLKLTVGVSYDIASIDSTIGWNSKFSKASHEVEDATLRRGGYGVHDVYYRYSPSDELDIDLGIDNVFDQGYRETTTIYEEGRSFVGKVTYKW